MKRVVVNDIS